MGKTKDIIFPEDEIDTVLADDIKFKGTLKFTNSLLIKGKINGEILANGGHLYINPGAEVKANIEAQTVSNMGKIFGNIVVSNKFELFSTGEVYGDITSNELYIETGAIFNGKSKMKKKTQPK